MRTGGQLLADGLVAHGSELAFCVPGESYLELLDGLYEHRDRFRIVNCRHEGAAANAADAYGKLTGRPGICMVTRGPGATHAATGVHTARQDSTPLILLVGQIARAERGRESFQELDYEAVFGPMAKWAFELDDPARIPEVLARAYTVADQRPARTGRARAARGRARGQRRRGRCAPLPGVAPVALRSGARRARGAAGPRAQAVRARRRRPVGSGGCDRVHGLGGRVRAAGRRHLPPPGRHRQHVRRLRRRRRHRRQPAAGPAHPRLRPADRRRHPADRDRDAGLHAARAAGRAAAARPRPPGPRRARARLPAGARAAQRRRRVRRRRARRRRLALGGLDRRGARGLRGPPAAPARAGRRRRPRRRRRAPARRAARERDPHQRRRQLLRLGLSLLPVARASAPSSGRRAGPWATASPPRWRRRCCTPRPR